MELGEAEKQRLAEELASWNDVSNWVLLPKSVLQHIRRTDIKAKDIATAAQTLMNQTSELYPDAAVRLSAMRELQESLDAAKQENDEAGVIAAYFTAHLDTLTKQAMGELGVDFLKQLKAKVGDRDMAELVAWLIEEHEHNHS